jgi:hypothetical protein
MAAISQSLVKDAGVPVNVTRLTMTASDTLTFTQGARQTLVLYNTTASPVTATLTGNAMPANIPVDGVGGVFTLTGGKGITVPASGATVVDLDDIYQYLAGGTVTITGGTGLVAMLFV